MRAITAATKQLLAPLNWKPNDTIELRIDGKWFIATMKTGHMAALKKFLERVPERDELKSEGSNQIWKFAATDFTAIVIDEVWTRARVRFFDEETLLVYEELLHRLSKHDVAAAHYAAFKEQKIVPAHNLELPADPELQLTPYQQAACYISTLVEGYALFMEQGTGKTPVAIAKANNACIGFREKHGRTYRVLIVCPKHLRTNWASEFARFSTRPFALEKLAGEELDRIKQLIECLTTPEVDFQVVVISYENMRRMQPRLCAFQWDLAVLDEGDAIKRPETARFEAAILLRNMCRNRMIATGTPITTTPLNLYGQLEFLYEGGSGFSSWKAFKSFYGKYVKDEGGRNQLVGVQNMPLLQERMVRHAFCITSDEALPDLPEKVYDVIEVDMEPDQKAAYIKLREDLCLEAENTIAEMEAAGMSSSMIINNVLTQMLRLAQITSGFLKWDAVVDDDGTVITPSRIERFTPNAKVRAFFEEFKSLPRNEKSQVWVCFKEDVAVLSEYATLHKIKHVVYHGSMSDKAKDQAEHDFNHDPETRLFIGTSAGGSGLNLIGYPPGRGDEFDTDCTEANFFSQDWKPGTRWQQEKRGHRRGTRKPFRIRDYVCPGTVDEEARARTADRKVTAMTVADVRHILQNILRGRVE